MDPRRRAICGPSACFTSSSLSLWLCFISHPDGIGDGNPPIPPGGCATYNRRAEAPSSRLTRLLNLQPRINCRPHEILSASARPADHKAVHCGMVAEPEVHRLARLREIPSRRVDLSYEHRPASPQADDSANRITIAVRTRKPELEEVFASKPVRVEVRPIVEVVGDDFQPTIVVEISNRRAA